MQQKEHHSKTVIDFITGKEIPDVGPEAMRQATERYLVESKGFSREDIEVNLPLAFDLDGESYRSRLDLVVRIAEKRVVAIKCAAGSLGSREREILAAARIADSYQIPFALVSDGHTAILLDTLSGKKLGEGWGIVPSRQQLSAYVKENVFHKLAQDRLFRERLIFRSYDSMNVNRDERSSRA